MTIDRTPAEARTPRARPAVESLERRQLMSVAVGLQFPNTLVTFDTATPGTLLSTTRVNRGLARREALVGIDYRPADGKLYAIGSSNALYTLDLATGQATQVGTTFALPLRGNAFGFDFNPAVDRIRATSDVNLNMRIDPNDGTVVDVNIDATGVQTDPDLAYAAGDANEGADPGVVATAHGVTDIGGGTLLFNIDAVQDVLVRQGTEDGSVSTNTGTLFTIGALGIDALPIGGFDIESLPGGANNGFAALTTNARGPSQLYTINLGTGAATAVGNIGRGRRLMVDIAVAPQGTPFFVATSRNELLSLNTATPSIILSRNKITGFASRREKVVGIDFRPATGQLWALTDGDRLYTLDTSIGAATPVGGASAIALTDRVAYGFDFNPSVDRIRVTNADGQNLRFNPDAGAVVDFDTNDPDTDPDTGLAYVPGDANAGADPRIVGSAYSNNTPGGTPTTLFAIDSGRDVLATQGSAAGTPTSPNTGQLFTVGAAGVNVPDQVGFDIVTNSGVDTALAVFAPGGRGNTGLFAVNTSTGAFTLLSNLNRKVKQVVGLAVRTP